MKSVLQCAALVALLGALAATTASAVVPRDPVTTTAAPAVIHDSADGYAGVGKMHASTVHPAVTPRSLEPVVVSNGDDSVWWLVFIAAGSALAGACAMFVALDVRRRRLTAAP